ncbi:MAG: SDR family oxidoreductase [Candidatus Binataceae bacterium]|nr:SDR family oxidoreductase [Candidatus Binataceae bacterium]
MPSAHNEAAKAVKKAATGAGAARATGLAGKATSRLLPGAYFRDRAVLITGASSGIGRDLATTFARMGAHVALIARRKSVLEDLAREIEAAGGTAIAIAADVTRCDEVRKAVERTLAQFNRLDVLINSAGIALPSAVETIPPEDLERMLSVNLMGTLHAMQAVLPSMRAKGAGSIVNIASLAGRRGMPPLGGYCATKFAVVGLTEALRVELYGSGIRVSLVMPGVIDTPMITEASGKDRAKSLPESMPAMPAQWVTWAVIAAVVLGLTEVDVPPGAVVMEKIAALFPSLTDAVLALGTQLFDWMSRQS